MKIVIASGNKGKIHELTSLLQHLNIEIIPKATLGVGDIEETGLTFVENALLKARHASSITGLPAIADDSGLAVSALKGAPGIYSARYAGKKSTDAENIKKLLLDLDQVADDKRQACFHCVLVYLSHANDPTPLICEGRWEGMILRSPQGEGGFGYDPVFFVPSEKKTSAELGAAVKNQLSHRGKAIQAFLNQLPGKI